MNKGTRVVDMYIGKYEKSINGIAKFYECGNGTLYVEYTTWFNDVNAPIQIIEELILEDV